MLGALAGGDALEIIVLLKDLSEHGLHKLESNVKHAEQQVNGTNFGGFSKGTKTIEKDAEKAIGKAESGGGTGILGMVGGLMGLGPEGAAVGIAIAGLAAVAAAGIALTATWDKIEPQEKALATAAKNHGIALDTMNTYVDASITANEQYAVNAGDTREAILALTNAGMSLADQQAAMPHILDLAAAKHISAAEAAKMYELALMGNSRGLKDLGINLPKVTDAQKAQTAATKAVAHDTTALQKANDHLATTEAQLAGKHHLTASEALKLKQAHEAVSRASQKLHTDQGHLKTSTDAVSKAGTRATQINAALGKQIDDARSSVTPLAQAQARLNDTWERAAKAVGPGLEDLFTKFVLGLGVAINGALDLAAAVGQKLGPILDWLAKNVGPVVMRVVGGIGDAFRTVLDMIGKVIGAVGDFARAVANSPLGQLAGGAGNIAGGVTGALGGLMSKLPHFAAGGWAGLAGPQLAIVGERGPEFITPAGQSPAAGPGGRAVHHTHIYLNGRQIVDAIEDEYGRRISLTGGNSYP